MSLYWFQSVWANECLRFYYRTMSEQTHKLPQAPCVFLPARVLTVVLLSRANEVRDRQHQTTLHFLPHVYRTASNKNPLFHEFFSQAVLLGAQSLSWTLSSCIFNKEKHTGQNITDSKCSYEGGRPGVVAGFCKSRNALF